MKTIQKIGKAKFKVSTDNIPNSELELNFNPIIDEFNLTVDYLLIHWQARPKGYRQWGVYASLTDSYHSVAGINSERWSGQTLQLDDATAKTVPSAVLLVRDGKLILFDNFAVICTKRTLIDVSGDSLY